MLRNIQKHSLTLLFFLLVYSQVMAQTRENPIDSLIRNMEYVKALGYLDAVPYPSVILARKKAQVQTNLNDYKGAISTWNYVLRNDSTHLADYNELAQCYIRLGNQSAAYTTYEKAQQLKSLPFFQLKQAKLAFSLKKYSLAKQHTNFLLQKDTLQSALRLKAKVCLAMGSISEGIHLLYKAVERDSTDVLSMLMIANQSIEEEQPDIALVYTDLALRVDSTQSTALKIAGIAYRQKKAYEEAEKYLSKVVAKGDSASSTLFLLGHTQYLLKDFEPAELHLRKANQLTKKKDKSILYYLGMVRVNYYKHTTSPNYDLGLENLHRAITLSLPDTTTMFAMYNAVGRAYLGKLPTTPSCFEKAQACFRTAYKYKQSPEVLYNLAFSYDSMEAEQQAMHYYKQFLDATQSEGEDTKTRIGKMRRFAYYNYNRIKEDLFMQGKLNSTKKKVKK